MKAMFMIAAVVFMAEVGCLLRSSALVTQYGKLAVFLGSMLGTAVATIIGVYLGVWAEKALPHGVLNWMAGLVLVGVGVWIIAEHYMGHSH